MTLVIGFLHFNGLHKEFLEANFDSVHGARTLLKARFLIDQAARDIETSFIAPDQRAPMLQSAEKRLLNAQHYSAEGHDSDPKARESLVTRINSAREQLGQIRQAPADAERNAALLSAASKLHALARDIDVTELDRWGNLAVINKQLASRMRTLNQLMVAAFFLFVSVMATLAWALLRTRRAEGALQEAKAETEAIQQTTLDAAPMGIAYVDTSSPDNRRITNANRQMAEMFGYPVEMMTGLSVRRLFAGQETYPSFSATVTDRLAAGEVVREEVVMQRRNGMPFWSSLSIKAINPADISRGVVWTCEDISKRKEAEAALLQERARAEAASQAKSDFLANMSHELRTPFTGLFGLLDLLENSRLDHNQRRQLNLARSSASHMQSIVNDILDFSKIEAGKLIIEKKPFSLRRLMADLAEVHTTTAYQKGLSFVLDIVEPLNDWLVGDPLRIRQIIDNLIGNAFKFTEQGEIRLTLQTQERSSETALLTLMVEDTGIGIPGDMQLNIFDKFTQADTSTTRLYGGTGLGLAICKQLTTLMGGQISVKSNEALGSRFTLSFQLPISQSLPGDIRNTTRRKQHRLDNIVVLLAEDNLINRNMLAETLELMGAVVWTAEDGATAIRMAASHPPDIVLMDCQMPEMDGFEATRQIRSAEKPDEHLPIIAITAFATNTHRDQCLAPGMMDAFVSKPLNIELLTETILELTSADGSEKATPARSRILLVDDNLPILEASSALISRIGYDVITASSGNEALKLLEAAQQDPAQEIDLVLLDCQMPVMDGWDTARRWRTREQELSLSPLAIIAVTADDSQASITLCQAAGMNETLHKPFTEDQLNAVLASWLH
ncbi:MAG: response regulator [Zoogloeaceae bacterium]|nr:response regulator [Zoogloeaceae bacterium]